MNLPPDVLLGAGMLIAFVIIVATLYFETKHIEKIMRKHLRKDS